MKTTDELLARIQALEGALLETGAMLQRIANVGKFRGLLVIDGAMKSPTAWAQETVDKSVKVLEAKP